jgi:hypothetical protein
MTRYRWELRTGDTWYAGTDATPSLGLTGTMGSMKPMEINDPDSNNDWEKGDVNHGTFTTQELGNLQTGTLSHDGSGSGSDWTVDYVKVTNDEDGRVWSAGVNAELKANSPYRLVFSLVDKGQFDILEARKKEEAARKKGEDADKEAELAAVEEDRAAAEEERQFRKDLEKEKARLKRELAVAKQKAELDKLRAQLAPPAAPAQAPPGATGGGSVRSVELFGVLNGQNVPLVRAVQQGPTGFVVVPGARVMRGDGPGDGFGLGGSPGRWSTLYSQSPADFGLPAAVGVLGSDGTRGWVLSGQFLAQLLGSNWQQVIS